MDKLDLLAHYGRPYVGRQVFIAIPKMDILMKVKRDLMSAVLEIRQNGISKTNGRCCERGLGLNRQQPAMFLNCCCQVQEIFNMSLEGRPAVVIHLIGIECSRSRSRLDGDLADLGAERFNVNADAEQQHRLSLCWFRLHGQSHERDRQKQHAECCYCESRSE